MKTKTEECTSSAIDDASANGHWSIVQFLHSNRLADCTEVQFNNAAKNGNLDVLKWLRDNVLQGYTEATLAAGALCGQLEVVQFLTLASKCFPWNLRSADNCQQRPFCCREVDFEVLSATWKAKRRKSVCACVTGINLMNGVAVKKVLVF